MKPDFSEMRLSSVGVTLLIACAGAGVGAYALTGYGALAVAGLLAGLYLLFAIRVADQWEKVAVLRFGDTSGCAGPGCST